MSDVYFPRSSMISRYVPIVTNNEVDSVRASPAVEAAFANLAEFGKEKEAWILAKEAFKARLGARFPDAEPGSVMDLFEEVPIGKRPDLARQAEVFLRNARHPKLKEVDSLRKMLEILTKMPANEWDEFVTRVNDLSRWVCVNQGQQEERFQLLCLNGIPSNVDWHPAPCSIMEFFSQLPQNERKDFYDRAIFMAQTDKTHVNVEFLKALKRLPSQKRAGFVLKPAEAREKLLKEEASRAAVEINAYIAQYCKAIAIKTISQNAEHPTVEALWSDLYSRIEQEEGVDHTGLKQRAENLAKGLIENFKLDQSLPKKLPSCCGVCDFKGV